MTITFNAPDTGAHELAERQDDNPEAAPFLMSTRFVAVVLMMLATAGSHAAMPMVSAGGSHTIALRADGAVRSWGNDLRGQLGAGSIVYAATPERIGLMPSLRFGLDSLSTQGGHALAIVGDGTVRAWGRNDSGQLGDGTSADRTAPVEVAGLATVTSVGAGGTHSVAVTADGRVWTWGDNRFGQLGSGEEGVRSRARAAPVASLGGFVSVRAGGAHVVALRGDGTVWTWGNNGRGQLGDGTTVTRRAPVQVSSLSGVVQVAAGATHTLAVTADGTVWAWGSNHKGQLCSGTSLDSPRPQAVSGFAIRRVNASPSEGNAASY